MLERFDEMMTEQELESYIISTNYKPPVDTTALQPDESTIEPDKEEILSSRLERLVSKGVDIDKRIIYFNSITESENDANYVSYLSVSHVIKLMQFLESINHDPIEIRINSEGGNAYDMLQLLDYINLCQCQIVCVGSGLIASSASLILCACDIRKLTVNSYVMTHEAKALLGDVTTQGIKSEFAHHNQIQDRLHEIYASNSHVTKEQWDKINIQDTYWTPQEALAIGLIDEIIEPIDRADAQSRKSDPDMKLVRQVLKSVRSRHNKK